MPFSRLSNSSFPSSPVVFFTASVLDSTNPEVPISIFERENSAPFNRLIADPFSCFIISSARFWIVDEDVPALL